jgi:hypothetical protein
VGGLRFERPDAGHHRDVSEPPTLPLEATLALACPQGQRREAVLEPAQGGYAWAAGRKSRVSATF